LHSQQEIDPDKLQQSEVDMKRLLRILPAYTAMTEVEVRSKMLPVIIESQLRGKVAPEFRAFTPLR